MDHLVINRRNPFEIMVLVVLILTCIPQLITGPSPSSVQAVMPGWWHVAWIVGTLLGSAVTLYGIFARRLVDGIYIECSGIPLVAVSLAALGAAQLLFGGTKAIVSAAIVFAIVTAFLARRRELRRLIAALPKKE